MTRLKALAAAAGIALLVGACYTAASWSVNKQLETAARHVSARTAAPTLEPRAAGSGGIRKFAGRRHSRFPED